MHSLSSCSQGSQKDVGIDFCSWNEQYKPMPQDKDLDCYLPLSTSCTKVCARCGCSVSSRRMFSRDNFHNTACRSATTRAFRGMPDSAESSPARVPDTIDSSMTGLCSANLYDARRTPDSMIYKPSGVSLFSHKTKPSWTGNRSKYGAICLIVSWPTSWNDENAC
jgi:hypothetical protein